MTKRRGRGEGSVYRNKRGRWCAALTVGYDEHGKRKRRFIRRGTKAEVLEVLAKLRAESLAGTLVQPTRVTVAEFSRQWLQDASAQRLRPTTAATYETIVDRHIVPYLGGVRIDRLTPLHCQQWQASLGRAKVSPRQRQAAYVLLKTILSRALKLGLAARNPLDAIEKPRVPRKEIQTLTPEQAKILLEAARGSRLEALFILAVATGARQGELFGKR